MDNYFFENIRKDTLKKIRLLNLQKKFETGLISENDLSAGEKIELEKLYDEQLIQLDIKIKNKKNQLKKKITLNNEYYKKLIEIKTKKMG